MHVSIRNCLRLDLIFIPLLLKECKNWCYDLPKLATVVTKTIIFVTTEVGFRSKTQCVYFGLEEKSVCTVELDAKLIKLKKQ